MEMEIALSPGEVFSSGGFEWSDLCSLFSGRRFLRAQFIDTLLTARFPLAWNVPYLFSTRLGTSRQVNRKILSQRRMALIWAVSSACEEIVE
jgi:hypothetical protein